MSTPTTTNALSRHQFLRQLGFQGAALLAVYCAGQSLTSCSKKDITPAPLGNPVTVDLTSPANAALKNVGGYIVTTREPLCWPSTAPVSRSRPVAKKT